MVANLAAMVTAALTAIKSGKVVIEEASGAVMNLKTLYDNIVRGGRETIGSLEIEDENGCGWKVKVKWSGDRGYYVKFKQLSGDDKFKASPTRFLVQPERYKKMSQDEWELLASFTDGKERYAGITDPVVRTPALAVINDLIYGRKLKQSN
ncbi:MAG: hypothetical protein AVO35_12730 [Candidatus Aegiribacteria sp. MLS_C]|nr:MAG: hypothetical protein AVO35_12730 [Candidatus Aegiribacteria sp. MLS_C]